MDLALSRGNGTGIPPGVDQVARWRNDRRAMSNNLPPLSPTDPTTRPEDADTRLDVRRPLTKAELKSMRREFKASSDWMERELAANPLGPTSWKPPKGEP